MPPPQPFTSLLKHLLNSHNINYLIQVLLETILFLLPSLLIYALSKNLRLTVTLLAAAIFFRLLVALHNWKQIYSKPPKVVKYAYCQRATPIDHFEKLNKEAECETTYFMFKEQRKRMTPEEIKKKEDEIDEVAQELQKMEKIIFNNWTN